MFFNNATCDVYIGTGAGKKLMGEIENAKRSVKIVSPFLVKRLIGLHSKGIDVQLITTDTIEDFNGDRERNLNKLIRQQVHIDGQARQTHKRWKIISKVLYGLTICFFTGFMMLNYWLKDIRLLWLSVPLLILYLVTEHFRQKYKRIRVYSYYLPSAIPL